MHNESMRKCGSVMMMRISPYLIIHKKLLIFFERGEKSLNVR